MLRSMRNSVTAVASCVALLALPAASQAAEPKVLVSWAFPLDAQTERVLVSNAGGTVDRRLAEERVVRVVPKRNVRRGDLIGRLRKLRQVFTVEPDRVLRGSAKPDDPSFGDQYHLGSGKGGINIQSLWSKDRQCAKVAVVDSGVEYNHKDLKKNIWVNSDETPDNGRDDDQNGAVDDYYGVDAVDLKGNATDRNGHGTHVSGIIGARGDNDRGVSGVCWSVQMLEGTFLQSDGSGSSSDAVAAINGAINSGAKVINCSWGGGRTEALDRAIEYAEERDVLIVAAAGNDGINVDGTTFPENSKNVLMVAATNEKGKLTSYSNYDSTLIDIAAPGDQILATYEGGRYGFKSGTSMATPVVAGTAALLRHAVPGKSSQQVRAAIINHAREKSDLRSKVAAGGILDAYAAYKALR